MCKRILTIAAIVFAVSGLVFGAEPTYPPPAGGHEAKVEVGPAGGVGSINQSGTDDWAYIYMNNSGSKYPSYSGAWIKLAYINQAGNYNIARTEIGTPGTARSSCGTAIQQIGNYNDAYQYVYSNNVKTTDWNRMGAHIKQDGSENWALQETVSGFGCTGITGIYTLQEGSQNFAYQHNFGGWGSTMEIYQRGNNNDYDISGCPAMSDVETGAAMTNPITGIPWAHLPTERVPTPASTSNPKTPPAGFAQYQNGLFSTAHIDVTGDRNHTAQYQERTVTNNNALNSQAYIDITGSDNYAMQGQLGEFNMSDIDITGNNNVAWTAQTGDNNDAVIDIQSADNCTAGIDQAYGLGNCSATITIDPGADGSWVTIVQKP